MPTIQRMGTHNSSFIILIFAFAPNDYFIIKYIFACKGTKIIPNTQNVLQIMLFSVHKASFPNKIFG